MKIPLWFCRWSIIFACPLINGVGVITFYFYYFCYWKCNVKVKFTKFLSKSFNPNLIKNMSTTKPLKRTLGKCIIERVKNSFIISNEFKI